MKAKLPFLAIMQSPFYLKDSFMQKWAGVSGIGTHLGNRKWIFCNAIVKSGAPWLLGQVRHWQEKVLVDTDTGLQLQSHNPVIVQAVRSTTSTPDQDAQEKVLSPHQIKGSWGYKYGVRSSHKEGKRQPKGWKEALLSTDTKSLLLVY